VQTCHDGDRVTHPDHGRGIVVKPLHESARGLGGAALVEALVRFDVGGLMCVSIDDLTAETPDDDRR
jgi:hypothetical protein